MTLGLRIIEPRKNLDNFYIDPFGSLINTNTSNNTNLFPTVDVYDKEDKYLISAELPGLKKNEINIDYKDNVLTISGEKKSEYKEEKDNFIRVERSYGKFERRFRVPEHVNTGEITANYKDGILEISIPKNEVSKPKKIDVKID